MSDRSYLKLPEQVRSTVRPLRFPHADSRMVVPLARRCRRFHPKVEVCQLMISQAYVDYMNGRISADEYRAAYPAKVRHLVKVPARRAVRRLKLAVPDLPTNPATYGRRTIQEGYE